MPPPEPAPSFAELLAALPIATLVVDPDERIAFANAAAEQMLNLSERMMAGRRLSVVVPPPGAATDGSTVAVYDTEIATARGGRIRIDFFEAEVTGHPGWRAITLHPAGTARGIGPASGGRSAIGAAAMLAHEIRNPLSGIRGAAQLLGSGDLQQLIITEVDRIAALIDRMQEFGDTRPLPVATENIYPALGHARSLALAGFARGIEIEERFDPSLPPALINRDALTQILINLLRNAREAVCKEREPHIILATAYRHGFTRAAAAGQPRMSLPIEVTVTDNGPGAPADIVDQLFHPFVSGRPEGQGLGLALVDKLVRDMGGIVQYAREGEPEMTVFRVLLPRGAA